MSENETETPVPVAPVEKPMEADLAYVSEGSGVGMRLGILLVIFVIAAGGILGYRYYLDSTLPTPDPDHIKREAEPEDIPEAGGAALVAPGA